MKLKRTMAAALVLLAAGMLSGCALKPSESSDSRENSEAVMPSDSNESTDSNGAVDPGRTALHKEMKKNGDSAGMAFLGFVREEATEAEIRSYLKSSQYTEKYAFLCEAPLVDAGGTELYAVVTNKKECRASVYRAAMTESGEYEVQTDHAWYDGQGMDCILLRCNVSDIHSNVVVSFMDGDRIFSVFPMISGNDGRLVAESCYDFSIYTDDSNVWENDAIIAYGLLSETAEVQHYTALGMTLRYTGQTQIIDGRSCWIFVLGTDHDDQFVAEFYYGVCDNLIYAYDAASDTWSVLGAG